MVWHHEGFLFLTCCGVGVCRVLLHSVAPSVPTGKPVVAARPAVARTQEEEELDAINKELGLDLA